MNNQIVEAAGPFAKLPKHWIKYLAERYGKGYGYEGAGEHSIVTPIKEFDPGKIRKALKDSYNLAVIGKIDGQPLFMISKHENFASKFHIFEVTKGEGNYDAKGVRHYKRRGGANTSDAYNINEVIDLIDKMIQTENENFAGLTLEAISKDPIRSTLIQKRRGYKNLPDDPLYVEKTKWNDPGPSASQKKRAIKYSNLKRPKLDARIDVEVKKIKDQINGIIDTALVKFIEKVKKGDIYSVNRENIANEIMKAVDITEIQRLAKMYDMLKTDYSVQHPTTMARVIKQGGLA